MTDRLNWEELWAEPTPPPANVHHLPVDPARGTRYAVSALEDEAQLVANAAEGTRNQTLNTAAFRMGRLVGSGLIDTGTVQRSLEAGARAAGLPQAEIDTVLRDTDNGGLTRGQASPRHPADRDPIPDVTVLTPPPPDGDSDGEQQPDDDLHTSWAPLDLAAILDGTHTPEQPALLTRTDGHSLLYPGRTHSLHGESESGKSLIAQAEVVRQLTAGHGVLYIDFESDAAAVVGRLIELGADPTHIAAHFDYIRPEVDPRKFPHERTAFAAATARDLALVVIDGVTDALGVFGFTTTDNDDIASFNRVFARAVATRTGAAVVMIDHVTKNTETRGRFAIGGQAKMAALDGAAYLVEVVEAIGQGLRGVLSMRVGKDRPGGVRAHAGPFRASDRTQEAARVIVDSTDDPHRIHVDVEAPTRGVGSAPAEFRPTHVMELVSMFVESAVDDVSMAVLEQGVSSKRDTIRQSVALLVRDGYLAERTGARNARLISSSQVYREAHDPASEHYIRPFAPTSPDLAPTSPGRGADDLAPAPTLPTGGGEVSGDPREPRPRPDENDTPTPFAPSVQVACRRCFAPTSSLLAEKRSGLCGKCATTAGLA